MEPILQTRAQRLGRAAGYAVVVGVVVTLLAFLIRQQFDPLIRMDNEVIRWATGITRDHPGFRRALLIWQEISLPIWDHLLVGIPACLWMWFARGYRTRAWWAFGTMMLGWFLGWALKLLVARTRPVVDDPVSHAGGYSFPSGHATNAATIATVLVLLFWPLLDHVGRRLAVAAATAWILLTCLDRIFLGVHFPSDVTGGVLLGCGLALASYAGYLGWSPAVLDHRDKEQAWRS